MKIKKDFQISNNQKEKKKKWRMSMNLMKVKLKMIYQKIVIKLTIPNLFLKIKTIKILKKERMNKMKRRKKIMKKFKNNLKKTWRMIKRKGKVS